MFFSGGRDWFCLGAVVSAIESFLEEEEKGELRVISGVVWFLNWLVFLVVVLVSILGLVLLNDIEHQKDSLDEGDCYDSYRHLHPISRIASISFILFHLISQFESI